MAWLKAHAPVVVLIVTLIVVAVLAADGMTTLVGRIDDARYLTLAEGLAVGEGFARVNSPARPPEPILPPGYPLLLAPLWWPTGDLSERVLLSKLLSLLAGIGAALLLLSRELHG